MAHKQKLRKNNSTISTLMKENEAETIYVGTRGENTRSFLRIYDKKAEQLDGKKMSEKHSRHEAKQLENWIRFEASFRGEYAHQLTEAIKECRSETELKDIIVSAFLEKYSFYYTKSQRPTPETKAMLDLLNHKDFNFDSPTARNNLLDQSIDYLINSSGLFPILWKVNQIWGKGTDHELLEWLYQEYHAYFEPNDDHIAWVKKYKPLYQKEGKPWKG